MEKAYIMLILLISLTLTNASERATWDAEVELGGLTCQEFSNYYGVDHGKSWGCAPEEIQTAWADQNCRTRPQTSTNVGCSTCQEFSNYYGVDHGRSWGCAPKEAQTMWANQNCRTRPQTSTNLGCTCQEFSNRYGVDHGRSWGCAPEEIQTMWANQNCRTRPQTPTNAGCSDLASEAEVGVARECTPIERPAEVLEIEPIMEDTNSPGYWFKFDDAEAKAYFKKHPSWKYMGKNIFIDSCGHTQELSIVRGSTQCDNTDNKLNCGRITANYAWKGKMDWAYEHKGENVGQKRWIALESRQHPKPKAEPIYCEPYPAGKFAKDKISHNNLGGKGPQKFGAHHIEYLDFLENEGKPIKLIVESITDYTPYGTWMNGVEGEFGEIGALTGTEVKLKFSLHDQSTGNAVTVAGLYFTVYDIDRRTAGEGGEFVAICDSDRLLTTADTLLKKGTHSESGCPMYTATVFGELSDNPSSVLILNEHQKAKSVTALYENVSSFEIILGSTPMAHEDLTHSRNYFFSAVAPLCKTDSPTNLPTVTPTPSPTEKPTLSPTSAPTFEPTFKPTEKPTKQPTLSPTPTPTLKPTEKPTPGPTPAPTFEPTEKPTEKPTLKPTEKPTEKPTPGPTPGPTEKPSSKPTLEPTPGPTLEPTPGPTLEPTPGPTRAPTPGPTAGPTSEPTPMPTLKPSEKPTLEPTPKPTPVPTLEPTPKPTHKPTHHPTHAPTHPPTEAIVCFQYPAGKFNKVGHNNLGGMGPKVNDPEEIQFLDFMEFEGKTLELVVTALTPYTPYTNKNNGIGVGGEFGMVGIRTDSDVKLKFTLKDQNTGKPVTIPGIYFTIYDLDLAAGKGGMEYVDLCGASELISTEYSSLSEEKNGKCQRYTATEKGTLQDNPTKSADLTYEQKARSVTAMYQQMSSFTMDLGATGMKSGRHHGRNFMFAAEAPLCTETVAAPAVELEVAAESTFEMMNSNFFFFAVLMIAGIVGYYLGTSGISKKMGMYEKLVDEENNTNLNQVEMTYNTL